MLSLDARLSAQTTSLIERPDRLHELVRALGSPLNIVFPARVTENVDGFTDVLRSHHLRGRVLFAHKSNQSSSFVRELTSSTGGIDVASLNELRHALGCGFDGRRIVAGGPKTPEYLWLAATVRATVSVDSLGELAQLNRLVETCRLDDQRVSLRLSGFRSTGGVKSNMKPSRFGIDIADAEGALELLRSNMQLSGVAFHLDTTSIVEKALAIENCVEFLNRAREQGHNPDVLDIGGGYKVDYLANGEQWHDYTTALKDAALDLRPPLGWNATTFGLRKEGQVLRGNLNVYEYHDNTTGPTYLDALLSHQAPQAGCTIGQLVLDNMFDLELEPGRALMDQCGITVARVLESGVRNGERLIRLDMNRRDLSIEDSEFMVDPIVVTDGPSEADGNDGCYFTGNLCLEADFVTRRKVFLKRLPRVGDLVVFPNTAGYVSDFSASRAIRQPIARRIAMFGDKWCLDSEYWPTKATNED